MKKTILKKVTVALLAMVIALGSTLMVSAATSTPEIVKVAPENVLNVQVVDEDGNPVDYVDMSLVNASSAEVAEWKSNNTYVIEKNQSGIKKAGSFSEPRSTFEALVAPYELININDREGHTKWVSSVAFSEGQSIDINLEYIGEAEAALTVDGNTVVTAVDSNWATRYHKGYVKINNVEYTFNDNAGKLTEYPLAAGTYEPWIGLRYGGGSGAGSMYDMTVSSEQTEYIKARIKLSEIYTKYDEATGTITASGGKSYSLLTDTTEKGANLIFVSGSVVTAPVPDSEGYIEIYVEKSTRKFIGSTTFRSGGTSGGGSQSSGSVYDVKEITVQAVDYPDEGTTLMNVPAGDYTIKFNNLPAEYKPVVKAVTVVDSNDVQTVKIVLEKAVEETTEATTEETTEVTTEETTEETTEVTTEETTEATTEETTEATTEVTAEETTEAATEATTEATVEATTVATTEATAETTTTQAAAPSTGDYTSTMIWVIMLPVSALALVVLFAARKKRA